MDQIAALPSTAIEDILMPTFRIFTPLLQARSATITATLRETHRYGPHPRQKVDIYSPPPRSSSVKTPHPPPPILIFLYGGGFAGGDRILPAGAIPNGLRRVNNTRNGEPAIYPSGADDIACLLAWVENGGLQSSGPDQDAYRASVSRRHLFILGNSAGGAHLATWLLAPQYEAARGSYLSESTRIQLSGAMLCAVPFHFNRVGATRGVVLEAYYGDSVMKNCPFGLLEALEATSCGQVGSKATKFMSQQHLGIPPLLNLEGELEPGDEILCPGREFADLWNKIFGGHGLEGWVLKGHNHVSPPIALMSGDTNGEKWGDDLVSWMSARMRNERRRVKI